MRTVAQIRLEQALLKLNWLERQYLRARKAQESQEDISEAEVAYRVQVLEVELLQLADKETT